MVEGRRRWLAQLKAAGKKAPCGRKKGGHNPSIEERERMAEERERVAGEKDRRRYARNMLQAYRQARRAEQRRKREEARRKAEEHAWRKARFDAGGPYWTDEEWENL
jgi:membrane protein involved in colicin uptake